MEAKVKPPLLDTAVEELKKGILKMIDEHTFCRKYHNITWEKKGDATCLDILAKTTIPIFIDTWYAKTKKELKGKGINTSFGRAILIQGVIE